MTIKSLSKWVYRSWWGDHNCHIPSTSRERADRATAAACRAFRAPGFEYAVAALDTNTDPHVLLLLLLMLIHDWLLLCLFVCRFPIVLLFLHYTGAALR